MSVLMAGTIGSVVQRVASLRGPDGAAHPVAHGLELRALAEVRVENVPEESARRVMAAWNRLGGERPCARVPRRAGSRRALEADHRRCATAGSKRPPTPASLLVTRGC